jgi:aryl-phospho-beta-D-glucosidase BglC (GH1 family)
VWYQDANAANLWVTYWATGEWWGTGYKLAAYEDRRQPGGVDTADLQAAIVEAHPSTNSYLRGITVAGGEFGEGGNFSNANPGVYDQAYHYDNASTFKFLASRGIRLVRLPFRWERVQRTLGGELDADELRRLKEAIAHARAAGMEVILDVHNYARYKVAKDGKVETLVMGTPQLPTSHLSDLWRRLSNEFKNEGGVHYGLMNEPHDIPESGGKKGGKIWEEISQTVLDTIRANGDKQMILVPGYGWSGVRAWREHHPAGWIKDPANNFRYEAHHYWDDTAGGQYDKPYSAAVEAAVRSGFKP